ncbi:MAG: hypothetical protein HYZ48_02145 [Chlamydiales bacterium]|nr:hypothetical protein [Chlamydiales bacterium]
MQLFAFDRDQNLLLATLADKKSRYLCPECSKELKVRAGPHRRAHYYHLRGSSYCRQHQKSLEHIQTQLFFLKNLPEGECFLEYRFPAINRIADVFWKGAKIVFEIQCSPISQQEVEDRTSDYAQEGLDTIWILHDKRFDKKFLSLAEKHLRNHPCYYTNIDKKGIGKIYDQSEVLDGAFRRYKSAPFPIQIDKPQKISLPIASHLQQIQTRAKPGKWFFTGDLLDHFLKDPNKYKYYLTSIEQRFAPTAISQKKGLLHLFRSLFNILLRAYSKEF